MKDNTEYGTHFLFFFHNEAIVKQYKFKDKSIQLTAYHVLSWFIENTF